MNYLALILLFLHSINCKLFLYPNDIPSPKTDPVFCNIEGIDYPVICDPNNLLNYNLKKQLNNILISEFPPNTKCLCKSCNVRTPGLRVNFGLLVVKNIKLSNVCFENKYDCFAKQILRNWKIGKCGGDDGLIIIQGQYTHIYFGKKLKQYLPESCRIKIKSAINTHSKIVINLRNAFKRLILYLRNLCLCNSTCTHRSFRWLSNLVFFLGLLVLISCVGGISKRMLHAKLNQNRRVYRRPCFRSNSNSSISSSGFNSRFGRRRNDRPASNTLNPSVFDEPVNQGAPPPYTNLLISASKPPPYSYGNDGRQKDNDTNNYSATGQQQQTRISDESSRNNVPELPPSYESIHNHNNNSTDSVANGRGESGQTCTQVSNVSTVNSQ